MLILASQYVNHKMPRKYTIIKARGQEMGCLLKSSLGSLFHVYYHVYHVWAGCVGPCKSPLKQSEQPLKSLRNIHHGAQTAKRTALSPKAQNQSNGGLIKHERITNTTG